MIPASRATAPVLKEPALAQRDEFRQVAGILGGTGVLHRKISSALDAHRAIIDGMPGNTLRHLIANVRILHEAEFLQKALGISVRTWQRRNDEPAKPLSQELGSRAWKFAQILNKSSEIFGSQSAAEQWLITPAIGLDQHRPIDLIATPAGVRLVEDLLERMDYGVYA